MAHAADEFGFPLPENDPPKHKSADQDKVVAPFFLFAAIDAGTDAYAVLVNSEHTSYVTVPVGGYQKALLDGIASGVIPMHACTTYKAMLDSWQALQCELRGLDISREVASTGAVYVIGNVTLVQKSDLGTNIARVPISFDDTVMLSVLARRPIMVSKAAQELTCVPVQGVFADDIQLLNYIRSKIAGEGNSEWFFNPFGLQ